MLSIPQELKNTESEVKKIREAIKLEKRTREAEASRAKQMQVAFKQASTKILSQVQLPVLSCSLEVHKLGSSISHNQLVYPP